MTMRCYREQGFQLPSALRSARATISSLCLFLLLSHRGVSQDFWTSVGPYSMPVAALCSNPKNGAMYALTKSGGVWVSMDGGGRWGVNSWGSNNECMFVSPAGTMYLGSQQNFWRSTNLGASWKQVAVWEGPIYAISDGPEGKLFAGTNTGGLLVSTNSGDNWSTAYTGPPGNCIYAIFRDLHDNLMIGGSADGIHFSSDAGRTWVGTELNNCGISRIASDEFGTLWAGSTGGHLYHSPDGGMHWQEVVTGIPSRINAIHVSRTYGIFIGTQTMGIFRSTDGGGTWIPFGCSPAPTTGYCFFVDNTGGLCAGTEQYLARTTDGFNWKITGIPSQRVTALDTQPDGTLFIAIYGDRVKISHDRCATISTFGPPGYPVWPVSLGFTSRGDLFVGMNNEGLFRTTNRGESWKQMSNGLPSMGCHAIAFGTDGGVYIGTNSGVYRSDDNGDHWTSTNFAAMYVQSLAVMEDSVIIAGTGPGTGQGMYRSSNRGKSWKQISPIPGGSDIFTLFRYDAKMLYAGISGYGILFSTDAGLTWSRIPNPLPSTGIHAFARNANGVMYAATDGGVYISSDRWKTWTNPRDGLWSINTSSVAISPDGYLYAGTYDRGVFRSASPVTDVGQNNTPSYPPSISLEIAPMPVHDRAVIRFHLPAAAHVRLDLLDALGRQVRLLEDEERQAGKYDIPFARNDLPAGLYLCKMSSGQAQSVKKLILVR